MDDIKRLLAPLYAQIPELDEAMQAFLDRLFDEGRGE